MKKFFCVLLAVLFVLCSCGKDTVQDATRAPLVQETTVAAEAETTKAALQTETGFEAGTESIPAPEVLPEQDRIKELLDSMTVEEKVGQMFFVRCPETDGAQDVSVYHLGGYLLFGRDFAAKSPDEVKGMIASYQEASAIPLFIGVDEEGGTVVRISSNPDLWEHKFLSPQEIFNQGGIDAFRADAAEKAVMLKLYGVNVNFAPVCDVSVDAADFIYRRSLGQDAKTTSDYVGTVVEVMHNSGVASVLKHFPGYGNNTDTHTGIAVDNRPYTSFAESDFLPFLSGIGNGAEFILVSHNIVTSIDSDLPASISPAVHELLHRELGFEGIILTDDLAMKALEAYSEDNRCAVMAVKAGNDMIVTTDYREQIPLVIDAVNSGEIDISVIDNAVYRILQIKYNLGLIQ